MSSSIFETQWDRCWDFSENQPWYPDEQVVRFLARFVTKKTGFQTKDVRHLRDPNSRPVGLDLGCGKGRHVVLMSEMDIEAHGSDISATGINFAQSWLNARDLKGHLKVMGPGHLPYDDSQFDFIICHGVLDHMVNSVRQECVKEVQRLLKPNGLFFFSVISEQDSAYGHGKLVEEKTWMVEEGFEKDIPQAFFDKKRIENEFSGFDLENITLCGSQTIQGRSLIGTDKHYQNDSRFYVTAKKVGVGMPIAEHPLHGSVQALLMHTALASGQTHNNRFGGKG